MGPAKRLRTGLSVLAVSLLLAGCGGSDAGGNTVRQGDVDTAPAGVVTTGASR